MVALPALLRRELGRDLVAIGFPVTILATAEVPHNQVNTV